MTTAQAAGGRARLVAGNWKMFTTAATARELAAAVASGAAGLGGRVGVLVCPPCPYLGVVGAALAGSAVALGAQNCYAEKEGAFTGEVSPAMLADLGCTHVILGHSERRHKLGENDELISRKVRCALDCGLRVILCVGETQAERETGRTETVLRTQFAGSLAGVGREAVARLVLAYEPVWAIGTSHNATPEQAQQAHAFLRARAADAFGDEAARGLMILYGGNVKPENVPALFAQPDVDGGLVGRASLRADHFLTIARAAL
jgi:triosephosphate isomerase